MISIRPLGQQDLQALKNFTDQEIGQGYYNIDEIQDIIQRSEQNGQSASLLLVEDDNILGVRLTYPPGNWSSGKGHGLSESLWPHSKSETAYFQSLFLTSKIQGQAWGGRLSQHSIETLKKLGAKGIVCHSWKESPNNSSVQYLKKLGFYEIREYPNYWGDVNYNCTRCQKPPCVCTAVEMYLDLLTN